MPGLTLVSYSKKKVSKLYISKNTSTFIGEFFPKNTCFSGGLCISIT